MGPSAEAGNYEDPCKFYLINRNHSYSNPNAPPGKCAGCSFLAGQIDENCEFRKNALESIRRDSVQSAVPLKQDDGSELEAAPSYA